MSAPFVRSARAASLTLSAAVLLLSACGMQHRNPEPPEGSATADPAVAQPRAPDPHAKSPTASLVVANEATADLLDFELFIYPRTETCETNARWMLLRTPRHGGLGSTRTIAIEAEAPVSLVMRSMLAFKTARGPRSAELGLSCTTPALVFVPKAGQTYRVSLRDDGVVCNAELASIGLLGIRSPAPVRRKVLKLDVPSRRHYCRDDADPQ